jgi:hypothetical protein
VAPRRRLLAAPSPKATASNYPPRCLQRCWRRRRRRRRRPWRSLTWRTDDVTVAVVLPSGPEGAIGGRSARRTAAGVLCHRWGAKGRAARGAGRRRRHQAPLIALAWFLQMLVARVRDSKLLMLPVHVGHRRSRGRLRTCKSPIRDVSMIMTPAGASGWRHRSQHPQLPKKHLQALSSVAARGVTSPIALPARGRLMRVIYLT